MKEEEKSSEKELNEMEASNLSDTEFKAMVIRMLNSIIKDMKSIKKGPGRNEEYTKQNNSRLDEVEDEISDC